MVILSVKTEKIAVAIFSFGAEDEARTRDPQLGRLMLYQLSYFRMVIVDY